LNKGSKVIIEEFCELIYDPEEDRKMRFRLDKQHRDFTVDSSVHVKKRNITIKLYDIPKIS